MKKIFLTGSSGFIGRNIQAAFGANYSFYTPGHKEFDLLQAEQVKKYLVENKFDIVIHAAGAGVSREQLSHQDIFGLNTKMFMNLAENSSLYGRLIFFGSGAEYGKQQRVVKIKESDFRKVQPEDDYGKSKYFVSEFIEKTTNIINLRLFGVFGPHEDYRTRFISNAICRALAGLPIVMNQNKKFSYVYVNDLAAIARKFIEREPKQKFYNIGMDRGVELLYLAKIIQAATGTTVKIQIKHPGMGLEYTCDNSLLMKEFSDLKFTPFEQSIKEMVAWYKAHWQNIDKSKLNFDA